MIDETEAERMARMAYEAYGAQVKHLNYLGLPMPEWGDLPFKIQCAWASAAGAVARAVRLGEARRPADFER